MSEPDYFEEDKDPEYLDPYNVPSAGDSHPIAPPPKPGMGAAPAKTGYEVGDYGADDLDAGDSAKGKTGFKTPGMDASALTAATDRLTAISKQRPEAPEPKWWQRGLAAAVGGLAGLSNAEGKRGPRIDPSAAEEGIYGVPQEKKKLADWRNKVGAAQSEVSGEQSKLSTIQQIQKLNAQEALYARQGAAADARKAQAERVVAPKEPPSKGIHVTKETGEQYGVMPDADGNYYLPNTAGGAMVRAVNQPDPAVKPPRIEKAGNRGFQEQPDGSWKQVFSAPRESNGVDELVEQGRQQRLDEGNRRADESIENDKAKRETAIHKARAAEVAQVLKGTTYSSEAALASAQLPSDPAERALAIAELAKAQNAIKTVNRKYAPQLEDVQRQYAGAVRKRQKDPNAAVDYAVNPDTLEYTPKAAAGGKPKHTEEEVRARASAAGADPEAAVKAAKAKHLI